MGHWSRGAAERVCAHSQSGRPGRGEAGVRRPAKGTVVDKNKVSTLTTGPDHTMVKIRSNMI